MRIFGQSSTAARTSPSTRAIPLTSSARFSSSTRSISTAIQDSMCEALSPSAIRWERFGMAAVSPLEMPRWEGTRATLTRFAGLPVAGHHEKRVQHEVDGRVLADQFGVDGVHEEGHVVGDDVQDAAVCLVTKGDVCDARLPRRRDLAVGFGPCRQDFLGIGPEILLREVLVVIPEVAFAATDRNGLILHAGPRRHRNASIKEVHSRLFAALMLTLTLCPALVLWKKRQRISYFAGQVHKPNWRSRAAARIQGRIRAKVPRTAGRRRSPRGRRAGTPTTAPRGRTAPTRPAAGAPGERPTAEVRTLFRTTCGAACGTAA